MEILSARISCGNREGTCGQSGKLFGKQTGNDANRHLLSITDCSTNPEKNEQLRLNDKSARLIDQLLSYHVPLLLAAALNLTESRLGLFP